MEETYISVQTALYKLNLMLGDPTKFQSKKLDAAYEDVAVRIDSIRRKTGFYSDLLKYAKTLR